MTCNGRSPPRCINPGLTTELEGQLPALGELTFRLGEGQPQTLDSEAAGQSAGLVSRHSTSSVGIKRLEGVAGTRRTRESRGASSRGRITDPRAWLCLPDLNFMDNNDYQRWKACIAVRNASSQTQFHVFPAVKVLGVATKAPRQGRRSERPSSACTECMRRRRTTIPTVDRLAERIRAVLPDPNLGRRGWHYLGWRIRLCPDTQNWLTRAAIQDSRG